MLFDGNMSNLFREFRYSLRACISLPAFTERMGATQKEKSVPSFNPRDTRTLLSPYPM
jgi:hypothetical protein